jgi:hypothetical protein
VVVADVAVSAGLAVPNGATTAASCVPGETIKLDSCLGPQACAGPAPSRASRPSAGSSSTWAQVRTTSCSCGSAAGGNDPISRALRLVGAEPVDGDATPILAAAAGLDGESEPRRILSAVRRRGTRRSSRCSRRSGCRWPGEPLVTSRAAEQRGWWASDQYLCPSNAAGDTPINCCTLGSRGVRRDHDLSKVLQR